MIAPDRLFSYMTSHGMVICTTIERKKDMRTGRTTSDKKDNVIKVRVNEEMMKYLEEVAKINKTTVSRIIRYCIEKSMNV